MQPTHPQTLTTTHHLRLGTWLFTALLTTLIATNLNAAGKASHVVVVVWDGMRPDFVSPSNTPALYALAQRGMTFRNHHPAYISTTEVNGTTLATGAYPEESTIIGNKEYRPDLSAAKSIHTEAMETIRTADKLTGDHYLRYPTLSETLQEHGLHTVIAGAKGVALLHDRRARDSNAPGVDLFAGEILPDQRSEDLRQTLGTFPEEGTNGVDRDLWTVRALTETLWAKDVPPFSLLWLSEPDRTQHETGPGSAASLAMVRNSDKNLARVLRTLGQKHLLDSTDIIVVSDHGFSTIDQNVNVASILKAQGLNVTRQPGADGLRAGEIMIVGNGGSVFLYVAGHDAWLTEKAAHCLQSQPFCGVVFTRPPVEGAFRMHDVRIDSPYAPDIVMATRWTADNSDNATPGLIYSDYGQYARGQGMHGSLSRYDMHNTCIACGPDFRRGAVSDVPSGNIDIAPTVLSLLGVEPKQKPSGRVLSEAFVESADAKPTASVHTLEATFRSDDFIWHQYLKYSQVNGVMYFDEGNGEQSPGRKVGGN